MNEDTQVQDPVLTDTQEPESNSPAASVGGNEETQSTNQVSGGIDPKEYENLKREKGKLKQVQEQLKQLKNQYDSVTSWVSSDADRLKEALVHTSGYTPEQADQYVAQYFQNRKDSSLTKTQVQPQSQYVDPLDQLADQEARSFYKVKVINRQQAIQKFIDDNQSSEKPLPGADLDLLFSYAGRLEKSGGLSPEQAISEANKVLFNRDELIKNAQEEGELRGLATASSIGSSVMSGPLGTQPKRTVEPEVPSAEWEEAQSLGFKDKAEYVLYRDNPRVGV
jgi:hypothetical protein